MKKAAYILILVVLLISLVLNFYHYGYRYVYQKGFNAGINTVSNAVAKQYKETGKIQLQMDGKVLFFEPAKTLTQNSVPDKVDEMFE